MEYKQMEFSTDDLILLRMSLSATAGVYDALTEDQRNITNLKQHILSQDLIKRIDVKLSEIQEREIRDSQISLMEMEE